MGKEFGHLPNYLGVKSVTSKQIAPIDSLEKRVKRFLTSPYLRPIAAHTEKAFKEVDKKVSSFGGSIVLDSGCGTGRSSFVLAEKFPGSLIVGIDKSAARLEKAEPPRKNVIFVRAELLDFWRLALEAKWNVQFHALYYPNPWPKLSLAPRRFHLHPIFPTLLSLSPWMELRTNWEVYAQEFLLAVQYANQFLGRNSEVTLEKFSPEIPETAFEKKYSEASQTLFRVVCKRTPPF